MASVRAGGERKARKRIPRPFLAGLCEEGILKLDQLWLTLQGEPAAIRSLCSTATPEPFEIRGTMRTAQHMRKGTPLPAPYQPGECRGSTPLGSVAGLGGLRLSVSGWIEGEVTESDLRRFLLCGKLPVAPSVGIKSPLAIFTPNL